MSNEIYERCVRLGRYMIKRMATIRQTAEAFGFSKTTVHRDVSERLKTVDPLLAGQIETLMTINREQRHIRGGEATRKKYAAYASKK